MNLLDKYKQQREALAKHKEAIAELSAKIKEVEALIKGVKSEAVEVEDIISESLEEKGIFDYYFHHQYRTPQEPYKVAIDGVTCEVSIDLNDGTLLIKEMAQAEQLQAA